MAASVTDPRAGRVTRLAVACAMDAKTFRALLPDDLLDRLRSVAVLDPAWPVTSFADPAFGEALSRTEVLLTGWGVPPIDRTALAVMPRLRAIVHGAGSVKHFVTPAVFDRGIVVSSAAQANAIPVAEFTFAAIIAAAKRVSRFIAGYRESRDAGAWDLPMPMVGTYGVTIGVVGASRIGRRVLGLLAHLDAEILLADPTIDVTEASGLGAELVGLDDLLRRSDIITLHAPDLPTTRHLLDARALALLRDSATVINTARGALVDTEALTTEVTSGRLDAVLDVTEPEPLPPDSPLFDLPNVQLTPHIAGSLGNEVARLGASAVSEIERLAAGKPVHHPVTASELDRIA